MWCGTSTDPMVEGSPPKSWETSTVLADAAGAPSAIATTLRVPGKLASSNLSDQTSPFGPITRPLKRVPISRVATNR